VIEPKALAIGTFDLVKTDTLKIPDNYTTTQYPIWCGRLRL
jgi:hypothetical protein